MAKGGSTTIVFSKNHICYSDFDTRDCDLHPISYQQSMLVSLNYEGSRFRRH